MLVFIRCLDLTVRCIHLKSVNCTQSDLHSLPSCSTMHVSPGSWVFQHIDLLWRWISGKILIQVEIGLRWMVILEVEYLSNIVSVPESMTNQNLVLVVLLHVDSCMNFTVFLLVPCARAHRLLTFRYFARPASTLYLSCHISFRCLRTYLQITQNYLNLSTLPLPPTLPTLSTYPTYPAFPTTSSCV